MKLLTTTLFLAMLGISSVEAEEQADIQKIRTTTLDCVSRMDVSTTWDQCRRLMFLPCEKEKVGSDKHITCLKEEKAHWSGEREKLFDTVHKKLTVVGGGNLVDLMGQWMAYVSQKCGEVALAKSAISSDAAQVGCEISENVGFSAELAACLDDRSTAPYCVFKE